jgi:hypothetical protein
MPIHVVHATSEVVPDRDEAEDGGPEAGQSWQAQEHVRAALASERLDRERTRAEAYGD